VIVSLAEKLVDILNKEADIYSDLYGISENKTKVLVSGKVSELDNLTRIEESFVFSLGKLEDLREETVKEIAKALDVKPDNITISFLASKLEEEQKSKLEAARNRLSKILEKINATNELNSKLIKNSLEYIEFSINLLSDTFVCDNNYGISGKSKSQSKRNLMDIRL